MRTLLADMAAGLLFFAVLAFTNDIYEATLAGDVREPEELGAVQCGRISGGVQRYGDIAVA
jgi:hypothetical protein